MAVILVLTLDLRARILIFCSRKGTLRLILRSFRNGIPEIHTVFAVMFINLSGNFPLEVKSTLPLRKRIILRSIVSPHERKLMSVTKPSISTQELEMHFNVIPLPQNEITALQVLIFMLSLS